MDLNATGESLKNEKNRVKALAKVQLPRQGSALDNYLLLRITYVEPEGEGGSASVVMKETTEDEDKYKQLFVRDPLPGRASKFKLYVYETDADGDDLEGTKFLDFSPRTRHATVFTSESCSGPSQNWDLKEHDKISKAWLIKSCDGRYLKNNGPGQPVLLYSLKRSSDRNDESLQWSLKEDF